MSAAATPRRILVVGAGVAGGSAALAIRDAGFPGEVVVAGAEPHHPYERPPLSKGFLRGEVGEEKLRLRPPATWEERGIEVRTGAPVAAVDPRAGEATFEDGSALGFDRLVLATGSRNRRLDVPGVSLEGVFDLRTVDDVLRLRAAAESGRRAVVVGMGFIGSEVAASLRSLGVEVTAVMTGDVPLDRVLGPEVGGVLAAVHAEHGVRLLPRTRFAGFEGDAAVRAALVEGGGRIECDLAVVGVGVQPNVELAVAAGLAVGNGVVVDERCRADAPNVLAAGDVAAFPLGGGTGPQVRIEHFQHAVRHGRAAGLNAADGGTPFIETPWFWSDQYDQRLQYSGWHRTWDAFEVRGSLEERSFVGFFCEGGVVRAVVSLNRSKELRPASAAIGRAVPADVLRDEGEDLRNFAKLGAG